MVEFEFDPRRKLLLVRLSGLVSLEQFGEDYRDVPQGTVELLDARGATTDLTSSQVRQLAERDLKHPENRISRLAILADSDVGFGLGRMYQTLSEGMETEVQVFRDERAALDWLGIEA